MSRAGAALIAVVLLMSSASVQPRRNFVIFVADGMRRGSITPADAPTMFRLRTEGVDFTNTHSVYPTLTMPNAAAIATGHYPGDTGQFANNVFLGEQLFARDGSGQQPGSLTPNFESRRVLDGAKQIYGGTFLGEASLLSAARQQGYNVAAIGKEGPTDLQELPGAPAAPPPPGDINVASLIDDVTSRVLPGLVKGGKPFVLLFWSPEPDQTQHSYDEPLASLTPSINGAGSRAAVHAVDKALKQLLDYLQSQPRVYDNTNVIVAADHGFSTVSRREVDLQGPRTTSYAATFTYRDTKGAVESTDGFLPGGHISIDLAHGLKLPLYDPDAQIAGGNGARIFIPVDPATGQQTATRRQRPLGGGLIGGTGRIGKTDAKVVVATSSIYVLDHDPAMVRDVVRVFAAQDYVGSLFVDDSFGKVPGTLPMSAIGMRGSATLPHPDVIVTPRAYSTSTADPLSTSVIVTGVGTAGRGNHGAFTRGETLTNMAAIGPDFKRRFADASPVSNADLPVTVASLIGAKLHNRGTLIGRVWSEALAGGPATVPSRSITLQSEPSAAGKRTILTYQQLGPQHYLDQACYAVAGC